MSLMTATRFGGFKAADWDHFEAAGKPQPRRAWEQPVSIKPQQYAPLKIELSDKDLFSAIDKAARTEPTGGKLHVLEWKLKARLMQLNRWAVGETPLPHTSALGQRVDRMRNKHAARKLFDTVGRSNAYFPSQWLFFHLNKLAANYGIDARKYFTRP